MAGLPQLNEEDVQFLDAVIDDFLQKSEATAALLIDKGGPLVSQRGNVDQFDTTTIAALGAGAFAATQIVAERVGEPNFGSIYQQGEQNSVLINNIDENLLLIIIFRADLSVGVVKYYATAVTGPIAGQMQKAAVRSPDAIMDLVSMNTFDVSTIFEKKSTAIITVDDILDWPGFAQKLQARSDPISAWLIGKLGSIIQNALQDYYAATIDAVGLQTVVVQSLNSFINGGLIYEEAWFRVVELRPETIDLL